MRTPLRTLVWLSGLRGAVEQCLEEGKTELGMDHYEGRKYPGWYHHMLTTRLAHFFLWHLKRRVGKQSSRTASGAGTDVVGGRVTAAARDGGGRAGVGRDRLRDGPDHPRGRRPARALTTDHNPVIPCSVPEHLLARTLRGHHPPKPQAARHLSFC